MTKANLLVLLATGCVAPAQYVYVPAVRADAQASGVPAAYYPIPRDRPTGDVRVATFGLTDVAPQRGGPAVPVLHVRMLVANNADPAAWSVDTQAIVATIAGEGTSQPAFVNTDAGAPPSVLVARGQQRIIDLFYPLPREESTPARLPAFDISWQITTTDGVVAERTPFERRSLDDDAVYAYGYSYPGYGAYYGFGPALGFAPYWWYDPWYARYGSIHHGYSGGGFYGHGPFFVGAPHGGFYGGGHYGGGYHGGGHFGGGHGGGYGH